MHWFYYHSDNTMLIFNKKIPLNISLAYDYVLEKIGKGDCSIQKQLPVMMDPYRYNFKGSLEVFLKNCDSYKTKILEDIEKEEKELQERHPDSKVIKKEVDLERRVITLTYLRYPTDVERVATFLKEEKMNEEFIIHVEENKYVFSFLGNNIIFKFLNPKFNVHLFFDKMQEKLLIEFLGKLILLEKKGQVQIGF